MAASIYPPMRGTAFSIGDLDYLYTTGFISELHEFPRAQSVAGGP